MRAVPALLLLLCATILSAQSTDIDQRGKSPIEAKFVPGGLVRMDLCSSGTRILGKDQSELRITYGSRGDDSDVRVRLQVQGDRATLRVTGCPNHNFQMTVEVPKHTDLYVRMGAGQIDVAGVAGNKDAEIHAGQINMELGSPDDYRNVDASVYTGQVNAAAYQVSKGGLFRSFERSGPGKYRVHAHVAAGQIDLR